MSGKNFRGSGCGLPLCQKSLEKYGGLTMKRKEAIAILQEKHDECKSFYDLAAHPEISYPGTTKYMQALQMGITALRSPAREQVEALRGEWIKRDGYTECSKCGYWYPSGEVEEEDDRTPFCPCCGAPMTDEAVEIVMKRLEALKDGTTD